MQLKENNMIPSFQGPLNTADITCVIPTAPVVVPVNSSIQNDPAPQLLGLKLLQLHGLPQRQQSVSHHPVAQGPRMLPTENHGTMASHQHKLKHSHQATSNRSIDGHRGQMSDNRPHYLNSRNCQPLIQISERPQPQKFSIGRPVSTQSVPLLHFKPVPHSQVTFPQLPTPLSSSHSPFIPAPMGEMPMIKLLYLLPDSKMVKYTFYVYTLNLIIIKRCIVSYIPVSVTEVTFGIPFTSHDKSHLYGAVDKFSDQKAQH